MAYLGRQPIVGNYQVLDALTASATATYALTKGGVAVFPQTPANCIVSLNGVIQAPFSSYNISGSNIIFASALTGSDSIDFITVLGDVLNVGTVSDNTITTAKLADSSVSLAKLTATGTKDATTFLRGDNTFASAGGTNTPAFRAYMGSSQTINDVTNAIVQYNTENFDTDSAYDTATYRFTVPSDKAGKYFFGANIYLTDAGNSIYSANLQIRKNGINISQAEFAIDSGDWYASIFKTSTIVDLAVGDYVDVNTIANTADGTSWVAYTTSPYHWGVFYGYKLIG